MSEEEEEGAWAGGQCRLPPPKHGVRNYPICSLSHTGEVDMWVAAYIHFNHTVSIIEVYTLYVATLILISPHTIYVVLQATAEGSMTWPLVYS